MIISKNDPKSLKSHTITGVHSSQWKMLSSAAARCSDNIRKVSSIPLDGRNARNENFFILSLDRIFQFKNKKVLLMYKFLSQSVTSIKDNGNLSVQVS